MAEKQNEIAAWTQIFDEARKKEDLSTLLKLIEKSQRRGLERFIPFIGRFRRKREKRLGDHVVGINALPTFSDLVVYVERRLEGLLMSGKSELDAFRRTNDVCVFRAEFYNGTFRLGVRFERNVSPVAPLDEKSRLWLERYLQAKLDVQSVCQNSDGGGYVFYTMKRPDDRYEQICDGIGSKNYWWDGGEWHAND